MEPQLFSCGLRLQCPFSHCPQIRFNGAATFQLRIAQDLVANKNTALKLQWSRNFSVADWMIRFALTTPHACWLQWSRNFSVADCMPTASRQVCPCSGFNGAATFQLRIAESNRLTYRVEALLQWSRNFSVADCRSNAVKPPSVKRLQWSRNFSVADCSCIAGVVVSCINSFNGAATFQLRIAVSLIIHPTSQKTLQWSRNFSVADCRPKK